MLMSFSTKSPLQYEHLSQEEQTKRGILGRLVGPMASFKDATRNGRKYTEKLWDKTFSNPIVIEKLENKCLFGELGHPAERTEIDMEKIAICLAEMPKKGDDGNVYGVFDILNTPNGRILKTMCDYGCNIGISSRGNGDVTESWNGEEIVEADSYDLECFDAVLLPAVKAARLTYVTESYDNNMRKTLKESLNEALDNSSESDRQIMQETLDNLEIDYNSEESIEEIPEENNINSEVEEIVEETSAADNTGVDMIQELQEALQRQVDLESEIRSLQEKLSVCYTKEARYGKILENTKNDLLKANELLVEEQAKSSKLVNNVNSLRSIISEQTQEIKSLTEALAQKSKAMTSLNEDLNNIKSSKSLLNESVSKRDSEIKTLKESLELQKTTFNKEREKLVEQNAKLNESLQDARKDSQIIKSEANAKLTKCNQLVERYKGIAKTAVDKYIESKAITLGISNTEIKKRLNENYSFNDIDKVCEDLQRYKLNMRALPFDINAKKQIKMRVNESKPIIDPVVSDPGVDDEIDETLSSFV